MKNGKSLTQMSTTRLQAAGGGFGRMTIRRAAQNAARLIHIPFFRRENSQKTKRKHRRSVSYDYATSGIDYAKGTEHQVERSHTVLATDEEFRA